MRLRVYRLAARTHSREANDRVGESPHGTCGGTTSPQALLPPTPSETHGVPEVPARMFPDREVRKRTRASRD